MTFQFRKATRENVHVLLGMMGGTGSGKTMSAMLLAQGLSGGKRFAVIDTEAGRAKHYADAFDFDHGDLQPPFTPEAYARAILAAEEAGYPAIVVDSMSHEHAGDGGLLDMFEDEFERLGRRDAVKMTAWIKPKSDHKRMVSRLLQLRAHLILCFRAEPKVKMEKDANGKMQVIDKGWQPICAKGLEFELTASFLLSHERPGLPDNPLKLPEQLRPFFPANERIGAKAGESIAKWAAGGVAQQPAHSDIARAVIVKIRLCADAESLKKIGDEIGAMTLAPADREVVKAAFVSQRKSLAA